MTEQKKIENVSLKTIDGRMIDGDVNLYGKSRVSELFVDKNTEFIEIRNTVDDNDIKKEMTFINKSAIIWVKPRDVLSTKKEEYIKSTNYQDVTLKTAEGVLIDGKLNVGINGNLANLMINEGQNKPFIIIVDAIDSNGNNHHTLFINKRTVIEIEEV